MMSKDLQLIGENDYFLLRLNVGLEVEGLRKSYIKSCLTSNKNLI